MHLKISSAKWQPFCLGRDELTKPHTTLSLSVDTSWAVCINIQLVLDPLSLFYDKHFLWMTTYRRPAFKVFHEWQYQYFISVLRVDHAFTITESYTRTDMFQNVMITLMRLIPFFASVIYIHIHDGSPFTFESSRDQSRYEPSQWETSSHCNDVSHWLGTYLDWSLPTTSPPVANQHHFQFV